MQPYLMSFLNDLAYLFWKRICSMRWCKPYRLDIVLVEELQETINAYCRAKHTPRYVSGIRGSTSLRVQP